MIIIIIIISGLLFVAFLLFELIWFLFCFVFSLFKLKVYFCIPVFNVIYLFFSIYILK